MSGLKLGTVEPPKWNSNRLWVTTGCVLLFWDVKKTFDNHKKTEMEVWFTNLIYVSVRSVAMFLTQPVQEIKTRIRNK